MMKHKSCLSCPLDSQNRKYVLQPSKPVDILFILESPNVYTVANKCTITNYDKDLNALRFLINSSIQAYKDKLKSIYNHVDFDICYDFGYVVSCLVDKETPDSYRTKKLTANSKLIYQCHEILYSTIKRVKPKIIIPVGAVATKSLYIMYKKFEHVAARTIRTIIHEQAYEVVPIMEAEKIRKNDNDYTVSQIGVTAAIESIFKKEVEPSLRQTIDISRYHFPKSIEELRHLCYNIILPRVSGENKNLLSVDIETNSKYAYYPDSKMIMISFSWGDGESCAIWCDSKHAPYPWEEAKPIIADVLASDARKIFHNTQFDYKFLSFLEKMEVRNLTWDTLLGEHLLDENMKGFYNLEFLAGKYFPVFENYKKLALKKISNKDTAGLDINIEDNDSEEESKSITVDNQAYQDSMMSYQKDLIGYEDLKVKYELSKRVYEQELELFYIKHPEAKDGKVKLSKEVRALKPQKPKKDFKKPEKPDFSKFTGEDSKSNYEDYNPKDLEVYGAMDADITRKIAKKQEERILKDSTKLFGIMNKQLMPAARVLSEMEFYGAALDHEYIDRISRELEIDYSLLNNRLISLSGKEDFKSNSPKQIAYVIHSKYGLPIRETTEEDQPKTDKLTLIKYAEPLIKEKNPDMLLNEDTISDYMMQYKGDDALGFISTLLTFRDVSKAWKTTLKNFKKYSAPDGRLRSNFLMHGTKTGRFSSRALNLQNLAKKGGGKNLKKCLLPDNPNHVLINVDIKAAEIRGLLAYAEEKELIAAIKKGFDMHCYVASKTWHRLYPDLTEEQLYQKILEAANASDPTEEQEYLVDLRKKTKAITFGIVYGITKYGLSRQLNISEEEAQNILDMYFETFPKIKKYMDDTFSYLYAHREVQSLTGRKRRFPRFSINKSGSFREAINFKVQNIASDMVVRILANMHKTLREELGGRIIITVHDSILISLPKENLPKVREYMSRVIVDFISENFPWLPVPFEYDVEWGYNYGEMQKLV